MRHRNSARSPTNRCVVLSKQAARAPSRKGRTSVAKPQTRAQAAQGTLSPLSAVPNVDWFYCGREYCPVERDPNPDLRGEFCIHNRWRNYEQPRKSGSGGRQMDETHAGFEAPSCVSLAHETCCWPHGRTAHCSGMPALRKASIFRSDAAQDGTAAQARNSAIVLTFGPGRAV